MSRNIKKQKTMEATASPQETANIKLRKIIDKVFTEHTEILIGLSVADNQEVKEWFFKTISCNAFKQANDKKAFLLDFTFCLNREEKKEAALGLVDAILKATATQIPSVDIRVRDTEYAIANTPRIVAGDELEVFRQHLTRLFTWYTDEDIRNEYAAPCMPVIQSSGTGKTKLLYDFRYDSKDENIYDKVLISCLPKDKRRKHDSNVYDAYLNFIGTAHHYSYQYSYGSSYYSYNYGPSLEMEFLERKLTQFLAKSTKDKLVILLDEAKELLEDGGQHMLALRKFLRTKREKQVVAIIAGTTMSLATFYPTEMQKTFYKDSGKNLFAPMYGLYTMGCFGSKIIPRDDASEFEIAVPYGRPLFVRLMFDEVPAENAEWMFPTQATQFISDSEMFIIASRMLMGRLKPFKEYSPFNIRSVDPLLPFISVWATRVQLEVEQAEVVNTIVAMAYGHITSFRSNQVDSDGNVAPAITVGFANISDPVCARLAMCMMQDGWELEPINGSNTINGSNKVDWTGKLQEIFSSGLCRPSRGDLGELLAATYLLFCGDGLRYKIDKSFNTFSVPVTSWVSCLEDPFYQILEEPSIESVDETNKTSKPLSSVNFIQFCRNEFLFGLKDICRQSFLEFIYKSGCAVYAHDGCPLYDAYSAIRWSTDFGKTFCYAPLLMIIKTRNGYSENDAKKDVNAIVENLFYIEQEQALVLVILLDTVSIEKNTDVISVKENNSKWSPRTQNTSRSWQEVATSSLANPVQDCYTDIVSRIISIPSDDPFNLSEVARSARCSCEETNVFASHNFAGIIPIEEFVGLKNDEDRLDNDNIKSLLFKETRNTELVESLNRFWNNKRDA